MIRRIVKSSAFAAGVAAIGLLPPLAMAESARLVQGDDPYFKQAEATLQRIMTQQKNTGRAKNVILFVGDGMGFSTVTAARILAGQHARRQRRGEPARFESCPTSRSRRPTARTQQVPDSAPTITAMVTGVKTRRTA